jgi:NAD+ kinase
MRRRVVLLGDARKPRVREAVEQIAPFIRERADLKAIDLSGSFDLDFSDTDFVVIFGGDGSILAAARAMGDHPVPTIGVNFGKFGFLTDIRAQDVRHELGRVLAGDFTVEERLMLRAVIDGEEFLALNEFYIGPSTVGRVVTLEVHLDGEYATTYRGDGLLVSTPTGSTGHSLSAGGPIVDPKVEAILLTPVSPHSLTNRPLVVPPSVQVDLLPVQDHGDSLATFSVDGQLTRPLTMGESVAVTRAPVTFPLARTGIRTRYAVLRSRLGWSGQPPYEEVEEEEAS